MWHIVLAGCNHIYSEGLKIILATTEHTLDSCELNLEDIQSKLSGAKDVVLLNSDKGISEDIKTYLQSIKYFYQKKKARKRNHNCAD